MSEKKPDAWKMIDEQVKHAAKTQKPAAQLQKPADRPIVKMISKSPVKSAVQPRTAKKPLKAVKETYDEKVDRSLNASTAEGVFNAASSSVLNNFVAPLALAFNASNADIGVLYAVQDLGSTIAQVPGAKLTEYYPRKSIWLFSQIIGKILFWLPIVFLPFLPLTNPVIILIALVGFASFFSGLRTPAWSSLMGDLVPMKTRGRYFGMRNMITGIAGIAATIVAGIVVAYYGFSMIFAAAILMSFLSIFFFLKMYEPHLKNVFHYKHAFSFRPREWKTSFSVNKALVVFTSYLFLMNFAVEVAAPFYTVYMLRDMHISYVWFALLTTLGAVVQIFAFKYWGKLIDRFGSRKILVVTGFFGCFTPLLWLFVSNVWEIALVKVFDGFVWGGLNLVVFNYLLDVTPANKRPQYVANHTFIVGFGIVFGDLTGAVLAESLQNTSFSWLHGLQIIFLLSFLLRLIALLVLPKIREIDIKQSALVPLRYVFLQTMAVEPAHGLKNSIAFSFRYPEKMARDIEKNVTTMKYKFRIKQ